ncbi:MAG: hypothetical protein IPP66_20500 [Anaerolineales bacterium]|nr:hypothetical protein [Anaerolineales bacterium]
MKKIIPVLLLTLLLASCGSIQLPDINALLTTPTPIPVNTDTPQPTVTKIPTRDLFATKVATPITFTPATTPLAPNAVPIVVPTDTIVPLPTFSEEFINDMSSVTFFSQNSGFKLIQYSAPVLYWGQGACVTRAIKITAQVEDPDRTDRVFLFLRLRDKQNTLNVGEWSAGAEMIKVDDGSFNYNVETYNLRRYSGYKNAWIEYELVSVNEDLEILGRTQLYDHNLTLAKCGL